MDKQENIRCIEMHLLQNGWEGKMISSDTWYTKGYVQNRARRKKYYEWNKICALLQNQLRLGGHEEYAPHSVINPNGDTDYVIAGIQFIHSLCEEDRKIRKSFWSFQPVIRSIPADRIGMLGYLPCFVNVCVIDINADIQDFIDRVEEWFTILSKCSIHISSLRVKIKYHTNAYDGIGLKICVHEEEIGQCNAYEIDSFPGLVLDFGFGLERICWAANGFVAFDSVCQKYEDFGLKNTEYSRMLSLIVLILKSGVKPSSGKFGLKLRKLCEQYARKYVMWNYTDTLTFYYSYWSRFLVNEITLEEVRKRFAAELIYQKKKIIARNANVALTRKCEHFETDELVLLYLQEHRYE